MENNLVQTLIKNKPAAEMPRKGAKESTTGGKPENGYICKAFRNRDNLTFEPRIIPAALAYATADEWNDYNAAVAVILTHAATGGKFTETHDKDEYAAAVAVVAGINNRAVPMRVTECKPVRIDNVIDYDKVDFDGRAPRKVVQSFVDGGAQFNARKDTETAAAMWKFAAARDALAAAKEARRAAREAERAAQKRAAAIAGLVGMGISEERAAAIVDAETAANA